MPPGSLVLALPFSAVRWGQREEGESQTWRQKAHTATAYLRRQGVPKGEGGREERQARALFWACSQSQSCPHCQPPETGWGVKGPGDRVSGVT